MGPVDIRGLLGAIRVPTLVLHRTDDRMADVDASRYLAAAAAPRHSFVELPGDGPPSRSTATQERRPRRSPRNS